MFFTQMNFHLLKVKNKIKLERNDYANVKKWRCFDPSGKKERRSDCGDWQWSVCVANEGDCGLGTREGTRTGADCKQTIKTQRCKIPCNWKKKFGGQGGRGLNVRRERAHRMCVRLLCLCPWSLKCPAGTKPGGLVFPPPREACQARARSAALSLSLNDGDAASSANSPYRSQKQNVCSLQ